MKVGWRDAPFALRDLPEAIHTNHHASYIVEFNQVPTTDEISAGPKEDFLP